MILRRLTEHVKAQNWFAVAIDFIIVVIGVFVGLQVQEWSAARGDRRAEIGYLRALEEDVAYSIKSLEALNVNFETQQAARQTLYAYSIDPAASIGELERDQLLSHGLFHLPPLNISQVTFETLKSSGNLGLIHSAQLVSALQTVSAEIADLLVTQADEIQVTYLFSDPMLVGNFDMRGVFQQPNLDGETSIPWLSRNRIAFATPALMKSMHFRNVLLYRSYFTESRRRGIHDILDQHRKIAALIDERQDELRAPE